MDFTEGTIADFDQLQADGLKHLRSAKAFFVATLDKNGDLSIVYCCDPAHAKPFIASLGEQVVDLIEEHE